MNTLFNILVRIKAFFIRLVGGCLYSFYYCPSIHESAWQTVSIHYTKEGAERAMREHKADKLKDWKELYADDNEFGFEFGEHEDWVVLKVKVFP